MEREFPRSKSRLPSLLLALLGLGPGLLQEAPFEAENEVLEILAGNSTQSLLERCSELLFGQSRSPPRQVNAVLGGSVLLAPALPPNQTVKEIEWSFSGGSGATIQVAEVGPGGLERPDPRDRFGKRLELFNRTALRIRQLQRGDSGVFGARIKMQPALVDDQSFNLSVYESVPSPRTRSRLLASTLEWCNLTLQCQGSGSGAVNVTWRRDSAAEGDPGGRRLSPDGAGRHQVSPDGTTLRVALPPAATNVTYACTVSNPADHKVAVFDLQELCRGGGGSSAFSTSGYVVLALILVAVALGGAFWCWRVNSEKAAEAAAAPAAEESPGEAPYSDIVCRSPPEGNDQGPSAPPEPSESQKTETTPKTETPKTETAPKTETPKTETTPKMETTPKTETTPKMETPKTETTPKKETAPKTTPKTETTPKSSPGGDEKGQRPPEDTAEEVT
ncbi:SLAM family member 5 [Poecile atricapillus]|uniref:SLAM family member 5 n=1 Tax=Poecile atricapillus TaxID=48891 RepID=UPI0027398F11|nr:SLAM family member 5 [Poecile atricapillus]